MSIDGKAAVAARRLLQPGGCSSLADRLHQLVDVLHRLIHVPEDFVEFVHLAVALKPHVLGVIAFSSYCLNELDVFEVTADSITSPRRLYYCFLEYVRAQWVVFCFCYCDMVVEFPLPPSFAHLVIFLKSCWTG